MTPKKTPYAGTQAVSRAIQLLHLFEEGVSELSMAALVKKSGLNRTTTYRLLSALESAGLVAHDPERDSYRLGSGLIVLGARAVRANPLHKICRPALVQMAKVTGEMASLELLEGGQTLIMDEVKGAQQRRLNTSIGNIWPAHATSTGKVLLACLSQSELEKALSDSLHELTPQTIIDKEVLRTVLCEARSQGFATAVDELEVGLTEIAAPIFNHNGRAVAAISIGGPTFRLTDEKMAGFIELVKETAVSISEQLGWRM